MCKRQMVELTDEFVLCVFVRSRYRDIHVEKRGIGGADFDGTDREGWRMTGSAEW